MPNELPPRVARRRTKAALPAEDQLSLFADDDTFDQPMDPRIVDPGGRPLPPVRHTAPGPAQAPVGEEATPTAPPALSVVTTPDISDPATPQPAAQSTPEPRPALTVVDGDAAVVELPPATDFVLDTTMRVPSGATARVEANIAVIDLLRRLDAEGRPATLAEQEVLARWSDGERCPTCSTCAATRSPRSAST